MSDQSIPHLHQVAQDAHAYTERVRRSGVLDTLEAASAQYAQHMQALGSSGILDAMETCQPVLTQVQGMVNTAPFREVLQHVDAAPPVVPVPLGSRRRARVYNPCWRRRWPAAQAAYATPWGHL